MLFKRLKVSLSIFIYKYQHLFYTILICTAFSYIEELYLFILYIYFLKNKILKTNNDYLQRREYSQLIYMKLSCLQVLDFFLQILRNPNNFPSVIDKNV